MPISRQPAGMSSRYSGYRQPNLTIDQKLKIIELSDRYPEMTKGLLTSKIEDILNRRMSSSTVWEVVSKREEILANAAISPRHKGKIRKLRPKI